MSGSFEDLDVPPTLISFAVAVRQHEARHLPRIQGRRSPCRTHRAALPGRRSDPGQGCAACSVFAVIEELIDFRRCPGRLTPGYGATAEALFKMALGNRIGVDPEQQHRRGRRCSSPAYGCVHRRAGGRCQAVRPSPNSVEIGEIGITTSEYVFKAAGETLDAGRLCRKPGSPSIESVFPYAFQERGQAARPSRPSTIQRRRRTTVYRSALPSAQAARGDPGVPGQQLRVRFRRAPSSVPAPMSTTLIVNNLTPAGRRRDPRRRWSSEINKSQIVMIPGGFSGGDEPDGSAQVHHRVLPRPRQSPKPCATC